MPTAELLHWAPIEYAEAILAGHPAPSHPETGEQLWECGIRLTDPQRAIIASRARYKQVCGGVRGGKSWVGACALYVDILWRWRLGFTNDRYAVVAMGYVQCEEEMNHLHRMLEEDGIAHTFLKPQNNAWTIKFLHVETIVVTMTAIDVPKISSKAYRGIVIAEAAQTSLDTYQACTERTSQTRGWVMMEGTFEDAQSFYARIQEEWGKVGAEGQTFELPSWSNIVNFPLGLDEPEIIFQRNRMSPERFMERYGGRAGRRSDIVMRYADDKYQVRHRFPHFQTTFDPDDEVWLFADPGATHAYAVMAVQFEKNPVTKQETAWVIDSVYRWNTDAQMVIDECAARPWAVKVVGIILDFAARQQNSNGPSNVVQWNTRWPEVTGQRIAVYTQQVPLQTGYDVHKRALLNTWPEAEARKLVDPSMRMRRVTDPVGNRLMFAPEACPSLWGGTVDGQFYQGEYSLHHNKKNRAGAQVGDDPVPLDDDAIKAINYGLYWRWGPIGNQQNISWDEPADWELSVA